MNIDVVIPIFEGGNFLEDCVRAARGRAGVQATYYLWDDCSTSNQVRAYLRAAHGKPQTVVHFGKQRTGFQANCNAAAKAGSGDIIVFLNADTFAQQDWLKHLVQEFEQDEKVGVVGAKLLYPFGRGAGLTDRIQHAGVARNDCGWPYHIYHKYERDDPKVNRRLEINAVTGAVLATRRSLFGSLGGFDGLFAGGQYADIDYCWRARKAGFKVIYQPQAVLYHYSHGSGEKWVALTTERNRTRLLVRWANTRSDEHLFGESDTFFQEVDLAV